MDQSHTSHDGRPTEDGSTEDALGADASSEDGSSADGADAQADLIELLAGAYEPWVLSVAAARGYRPEDLRTAIDQGRAWLADALAELLFQPFDRQPRGPLEVFQDAMRFPTAALRSAGHSAVTRDDVAVRALPGDVYDLAPASSQVLGEEVWRAHMAWGMAKAAAAARPKRPSVGVFTRNLMDRSRFDGFGYDVTVWTAPGDIASPPRRCFVDLSTDGADDAIRALAEEGCKVIAFGPHVDDFAMVRARTLGAEDALARSVFFRRLPELLPKFV